MDRMENIHILAKGKWETKELSIRQIANLSNILQEEVIYEIEEKWKKFKKERGAFGKTAKDNPTICYLNHSHDKNKLVLNVVTSTYKTSLTLGYVGCAMMPITTDNYIVLVNPTDKRENRFGKGISPAGGTPHCIEVASHVCIEMQEEFGVSVKEGDLEVLGLIQLCDPRLQPHHCLAFRVNTKYNKKNFLNIYNREATDKEGLPVFIAIDRRGQKIDLTANGNRKINEFNYLSFEYIRMFAENEFGVSWPKNWYENIKYYK